MELAVLEAIADKFHGVPIGDLFDLVVGTSTGAIVGAGLVTGARRRTPTAMVAMFRDLATRVFDAGVLEKVWRLIWRRSAYAREPLHEVLVDALGEERLWSSGACPLFAVTACTIEDGAPRAVVLPSYNRIGGGPGAAAALVVAGATVTAAVEASSAAAPYLPVFEWQRRGFIDGGFMNNNPVEVAVAEAALLWPGRTPDVVLSLGTGTPPGEASFEKALEFVKAIVDIVVDSQRAWDRAVAAAGRQGHAERYTRINPPLPAVIELDDASKVDDAYNAARLHVQAHVPALAIEALCDRLLAALFYVAVDARRAGAPGRADATCGGVVAVARSRDTCACVRSWHADGRVDAGGSGGAAARARAAWGAAASHAPHARRAADDVRGEGGTIDIRGRILARAALPAALAALVPGAFVVEPLAGPRPVPGEDAGVVAGVVAARFQAGATVANFVVRRVPVEARSFMVAFACTASLTRGRPAPRNAISGSPVDVVALW
jgi:predicted acylesterase/phospholipase RssA